MEVSGVNSQSTLDSVENKKTQVTDDSFEKRLREAAAQGDDGQLKEVCKEFESIFLSMLYKQMRATVPESEYLKSDSATDIYNSMLDEQLCEISSQKGIGLGDMLYKQMSKQYNISKSSTETSGGAIDEKK